MTITKTIFKAKCPSILSRRSDRIAHLFAYQTIRVDRRQRQPATNILIMFELENRSQRARQEA